MTAQARLSLRDGYWRVVYGPAADRDQHVKSCWVAVKTAEWAAMRARYL